MSYPIVGKAVCPECEQEDAVIRADDGVLRLRWHTACGLAGHPHCHGSGRSLASLGIVRPDAGDEGDDETIH